MIQWRWDYWRLREHACPYNIFLKAMRIERMEDKAPEIIYRKGASFQNISFRCWCHRSHSFSESQSYDGSFSQNQSNTGCFSVTQSYTGSFSVNPSYRVQQKSKHGLTNVWALLDKRCQSNVHVACCFYCST